jgi:pyridoxine 5-phosphate synthase
MKILGVNVDHIATLRNARGEGYPNLLDLTQLAINSGADQITAHLREDRRHIKDNDMFDIARNINVPLNMEMALNQEMLEIALQIKPHSVCLVPEKREEITTEGGLNLLENKEKLQKYMEIFKSNGILVSLFIDSSPKQIDVALNLNPHSVEINTGSYARTYKNNNDELNKINQAIQQLKGSNIAIHCGHGLNFDNIHPLVSLDEIVEYNIGHFLISYALHVGLGKSIMDMKKIITGIN